MLAIWATPLGISPIRWPIAITAVLAFGIAANLEPDAEEEPEEQPLGEALAEGITEFTDWVDDQFGPGKPGNN